MILLFVAAAVACGTMGLALRTPESREKVSKKPFSWTARLLGLGLMWKLIMVSLPGVGYFFDCFYSSMSGLTSAATLAAECLGPFCDLLGLPAPLAPAGLRVTAQLLASSGGSGIGLSLWFGTPACSSTFLWLSILQSVDAALFGFAWWQGEGGGLMGLVRGRGV